MESGYEINYLSMIYYLSGYEINYLFIIYHQGEFPNFTGNFTWGISQLYGMDRNIFHIAEEFARASTRAIFSSL